MFIYVLLNSYTFFMLNYKQNDNLLKKYDVLYSHFLFLSILLHVLLLTFSVLFNLVSLMSPVYVRVIFMTSFASSLNMRFILIMVSVRSWKLFLSFLLPFQLSIVNISNGVHWDKNLQPIHYAVFDFQKFRTVAKIVIYNRDKRAASLVYHVLAFISLGASSARNIPPPANT